MSGNEKSNSIALLRQHVDDGLQKKELRVKPGYGAHSDRLQDVSQKQALGGGDVVHVGQKALEDANRRVAAGGYHRDCAEFKGLE